MTILQSAKTPLDNLGQNGFGTLGLSGAFLVEFILTFVFVLVIVAVTGKRKFFSSRISNWFHISFSSLIRYSVNWNFC